MAERASINGTASSPIGWLSWRCSICGLPFTGADSAALELVPLELGHLCERQLNSDPPWSIAFALDGDDRVFCLRPEFGSTETVATDHHDEQSVTFG